jgi:hypothetical protein
MNPSLGDRSNSRADSRPLADLGRTPRLLAPRVQPHRQTRSDVPESQRTATGEFFRHSQRKNRRPSTALTTPVAPESVVDAAAALSQVTALSKLGTTCSTQHLRTGCARNPYVARVSRRRDASIRKRRDADHSFPNSDASSKMRGPGVMPVGWTPAATGTTGLSVS